MPGRRQFGSVRQLNSGRFQARYVGPDGLRRDAPNTFVDKRDAQAWLTLRESEILRGEWLNPDDGRELLDLFAVRWLEEHKMSARTREEGEWIYQRHVQPFLGHREVSSIKVSTIRTWRTDLLKAGRSEDATAKAYRLVRAMMSTAVEDEMIRRNPCTIKGADTARRRERSVASVAQVQGLAEVLGGRWRVFILTAAFTGIRWGELIALRRSDVDLTNGTIKIRRAYAELRGGRLVLVPPKSEASERDVTIPSVLVAELEIHLKEYVGESDEALVFLGDRGGIPKRGSWRSTVKWTTKIAEAGLPKGFTFHDLRHTGNHLASQSGASTKELMGRMGHSTMRAALIYQHATDQRAREIADRLGQMIENEMTKGGAQADERDPASEDDDGAAGVPAPTR